MLARRRLRLIDQRALMILSRKVLLSMACGFCAALTSAQDGLVPLRFLVHETNSQVPLPCRIHLQNSSGEPVHPPNLPFWKDHFVCAGDVELRLHPGSYSYAIERGPEYATATGQLTLIEKLPQTVTNRLRRLANLAREGWWSGELHVHRPLSEIELLMQAEDLHVAPVITWWNNSNLWAKQPIPKNPLVQFEANRFYHVMGGEDERGGGALLYFNLGQPLPITGARREYPSPMHFLRQARQSAKVWVDLEKPFWYDAPVWLASGMVDSVGIANNHMHRNGMLPNEAWGRERDRRRLPDPKGNGLWTQEIYYHALNCGLRLPPSAGSASGVLPNPVGYNRVYVHLDDALTYEKWWEGLRSGEVFVSNGPLLRCRADGKLPGHIFKIRQGELAKIALQAALDSRDQVTAIEIIKNGKVDRTVPAADLKQSGSLGEIRFEGSGWFLIRAVADVPNTFRFASTGPFYVEAGRSRISKGSAQFFVEWVQERMDRLKLDAPEERAEVLEYHRAAENFWKEKVSQANAD